MPEPEWSEWTRMEDVAYAYRTQTWGEAFIRVEVARDKGTGNFYDETVALVHALGGAQAEAFIAGFEHGASAESEPKPEGNHG